MKMSYVFIIACAAYCSAASGKEPVDADDDGWSDAFSDSEWDEYDDESTGYWAWLERHEHAAELELQSRAAGASCSTDRVGGRPSEHEVDIREFAQRCFEFHGDNQVGFAARSPLHIAHTPYPACRPSSAWVHPQERRLAEHFQMSLPVVKYWKAKLGLTWIQTGGQRPLLPSSEMLEALWAEDPCLSVTALAERYRVDAKTMRTHLASMGFRPDPVVDDAPVMEALSKLLQRGWCSNIGVGFAEACLRREFGIIAPAKQIRRCLKALDPVSHKQRAKAAAKTKYVYTVILYITKRSRTGCHCLTAASLPSRHTMM